MRVAFITLLLITTCTAKSGFGRGHGTSHSYPHSTGYSGVGTGGASHSYPHTTGMSGNSNYPRQTSTHQHTSSYQPHTTYNSRTEVHHHYHYSPPASISYGAHSHPVYQGPLPVYVYEYRDSGSRFDTLLTGLALYNLGRSTHHHHDSQYRGTPGEICKLGISKQNGEYEETRIDCKLMSSFIFEFNTQPQSNQHVVVSDKVTTNVQSNGTWSNSVTVKQTVVSDAVSVRGPSMVVTPGMTCFMIRILRDSSVLKKNVECALLQEYARRSLYRSTASRKIISPVLLVIYIMYSIFKI